MILFKAYFSNNIHIFLYFVKYLGWIWAPELQKTNAPNCKKVPNCKIKFQIVKSSKIIMRHNFQLGMDFIEVKATGGMISYALRQAFMPKAS